MGKRPPPPTQERLKEMLAYDPETGDFTWLKRTGGQCKVGTKAGSLNSDGYWCITLDRRTDTAHRLAFIYMTGKPADGLIDHINGERTDNRWSNLRIASHALNSRNRRPSRTKKDNLPLGVWRNYKSSTYIAAIGVNGKQRTIGYFKTVGEAEAAYLAEKKRLHGL